MQMLYNSDSFVVVAFEVPGAEPVIEGDPVPPRGGFEIVDKLARKEIFLQGDVAASFQQGVQALVDSDPTEEAMDEFIGRFTVLAQQPLVLH
ncbi:DUF3567 domain-containing protein [Aquabacterium sp.]|uniref:BTH_I0359 family protein n=1 Tax=Aquabacterium sp. TaxID=1872578 RepID=UPI0037830C36